MKYLNLFLRVETFFESPITFSVSEGSAWRVPFSWKTARCAVKRFPNETRTRKSRDKNTLWLVALKLLLFHCRRLIRVHCSLLAVQLRRCLQHEYQDNVKELKWKWGIGWICWIRLNLLKLFVFRFSKSCKYHYIENVGLGKTDPQKRQLYTYIWIYCY